MCNIEKTGDKVLLYVYAYFAYRAKYNSNLLKTFANFEQMLLDC